MIYDTDEQRGLFWWRKGRTPKGCRVAAAGIRTHGVTLGAVIFDKEVQLRARVFPQAMFRGRPWAADLPFELAASCAFGWPPELPNIRRRPDWTSGRIGALFSAVSWAYEKVRPA